MIVYSLHHLPSTLLCTFIFVLYVRFRNQFWLLSSANEIRRDDRCFDSGVRPKSLGLFACHGQGGNQRFTYDQVSYPSFLLCVLYSLSTWWSGTLFNIALFDRPTTISESRIIYYFPWYFQAVEETRTRKLLFRGLMFWG